MISTDVRKEMNANFRVVVEGSSLGRRVLVGWCGLVCVLGRSAAFLAVSRALSSRTDKCTINRRNGLKIEFYAK